LHMVSDKKLFINLDKSEKGVINTSCWPNSLRTEGKGLIILHFKKKPIVFHNVLFVPNITVNLLSLRHLLLEQCKVNFFVNHFSVLKNDELLLEGNYHCNIPVVNFELPEQHSHLSAA
jgi:hypothetical protein